MPDTDYFKEYTTGMYYDPRVTMIDDKYYVVFACHSGHSCRLGLLESPDMKEFKFKDFISEQFVQDKQLGKTLADGGIPSEGVMEHMDDFSWMKLQEEFLAK